VGSVQAGLPCLPRAILLCHVFHGGEVSLVAILLWGHEPNKLHELYEPNEPNSLSTADRFYAFSLNPYSIILNPVFLTHHPLPVTASLEEQTRQMKV